MTAVGHPREAATRGATSRLSQWSRRVGVPPGRGTIQNCHHRSGLFHSPIAETPSVRPLGENASAPSTKRRSANGACLVAAASTASRDQGAAPGGVARYSARELTTLAWLSSRKNASVRPSGEIAPRTALSTTTCGLPPPTRTDQMASRSWARDT